MIQRSLAEGVKFLFLGLCFIASWVSIPWWGWVIFCGLLSAGLCYVALKDSLEGFFLSCASCILLLSCIKFPLTGVWCFLLYSLMPLLFIAFFRRFLGKQDEETYSFFHWINGLLSFVTFCFSWWWVEQKPLLDDSGLFGGILLCLPGILSIASGYIFALQIITFRGLQKTEDLLSFQVNTSDYWILISYQICAILFARDRFLFYNMILTGFLPFVLDGLLSVYRKRFMGKERVFYVYNVLATLTVAPFLYFVFSSMFKPWIKNASHDK